MCKADRGEDSDCGCGGGRDCGGIGYRDQNFHTQHHYPPVINKLLPLPPLPSPVLYKPGLNSLGSPEQAFYLQYGGSQPPSVVENC